MGRRGGVAELAAQPGFAEAFLPQGRAPHVGERFVFADAARSLRLVAASRGEAYYRGEIAAAIARHAKAHGGAMSAADLAAYRPQWVETVAQHYRGHELHEIPPNGQGITALIALGILEQFDDSRRCRSTARPRSTCRSRPSSSPSPTPIAMSPSRRRCRARPRRCSSRPTSRAAPG